MKIKAAYLFFLLLFLSGCSSNSFLGSRFDNFSAYYNKYYNAERSLSEGIREFEKRLEEQPIDQDIFLSLFGRSEQASTQRKPFEDAITKSADILREHPKSKWVDDAIMVIGKAWFFTLNFVGAEEKFNDILELDSPLSEEANFWLARTLIASGAYEEASTHLQTLVSAENLSSRWGPQYRLALAELYVQSENWEEAAIELEAGLDGIRDRNLASRAQFLEGQVFEQLGQYSRAVNSYERVQQHKPFYELSYAAQFNAIRILAQHLDPEEAMRQLRRMERDDKNYDHRAELAYLRGRVLIALGYYNEALDQYDELLYDPTAGGASVRGRVHYALGTFYRDVYLDFPYAAAHFDTAAQTIKTSSGRQRSSNRMVSVEPRPSPGAITDSEDQAEKFGSFSEVLDQIVLMDSLLYLGTLDDSSFAEVVLELRRRRAKELEEMQRSMLQRRSEAAFRGNPGAVDDDDGFGTKTLVAGTEGEAGFLYHKDEVRMLQARQDFVLTWGDRPLAPNWRRIAAIESSQIGDPKEGGDDSENQVSLSTTMPVVDISDVPRTQEKFDAMLTKRANARYELANVLFLSMNQPDSASAWYRMVIEQDRDEEVTERAYYALAEVHRTLGDTLASNRLYERIISNYAESDLVDQAYARLGRQVPVRTTLDSLAQAENEYAEYLSKWREEASEEIIAGLYTLGMDWSTTPVAPRALYASSRAFLEWAAKDSMDVLGPLPISADPVQMEVAGFYSGLDSTSTAKDSLLSLPMVLGYIQTNYRESPQASQVGLMLNALQEEKRKRQATADSLQRAADSLATDSFAIADSLLDMEEDSLALEAMPDSLIQTVDEPTDSLQSVELSADSLRFAAPEDTLFVPNPSERSPELMSKLNMEINAETVTEIQNKPLVPVIPERMDRFEDESSDSLVLGEFVSDSDIGNHDLSQGGYTIQINSYSDQVLAKEFIVSFEDSHPDISHPLDIFDVIVDGRLEFRVGLGRFETVMDAESVIHQLSGQIPTDARIIQISDRNP